MANTSKYLLMNMQIANALDQIITIQASYPEEIIKLSRERPMQQSDGRFLPGRFDNVENTKGRSLVPANASKTSNQLFIEMSSEYILSSACH